jgi:hypothetical protein
MILQVNELRSASFSHLEWPALDPYKLSCNGLSRATRR